jgi:hypothetical protein
MTAQFFSQYEEMTGFHVLLSVQVQNLLAIHYQCCGSGSGRTQNFGSGIIVSDPDPKPNHLLHIKMIKICKLFVNLSFKMVQSVFDYIYVSLENFQIA